MRRVIALACVLVVVGCGGEPTMTDFARQELQSRQEAWTIENAVRATAPPCPPRRSQTVPPINKPGTVYCLITDKQNRLQRASRVWAGSVGYATCIIGEPIDNHHGIWRVELSQKADRCRVLVWWSDTEAPEEHVVPIINGTAKITVKKTQQETK